MDSKLDQWAKVPSHPELSVQTVLQKSENIGLSTKRGCWSYINKKRFPVRDIFSLTLFCTPFCRLQPWYQNSYRIVHRWSCFSLFSNCCGWTCSTLPPLVRSLTPAPHWSRAASLDSSSHPRYFPARPALGPCRTPTQGATPSSSRSQNQPETAFPDSTGPSSLTPSWRRHEPSSGWRASTRWWSCVMPLPTLPSWKPGNNSCRSGKDCPERALDPGMEMGNLRWSILWLGSVTPAWLPVKCCANGWRTAWPTVPPTGPVASCRHHANVGTSLHRTKKPVDATGTGYTWRTASLLWKKEQLTLTLAVS